MPRVTVPAPSGGLNVLVDPDAIELPDAIRCTNMIPRIGGLELRLGTLWASSPGGGTAITTLAPHSNGTIVAAYGANLNARTASGVWPSVATVGGKTNAEWNYTQYQDILIMCNGADTPVSWNGTAFGLLVITGVTASTLIGCQTFKGRVYYWQANARSFWYDAANAFQGALNQFGLGTFVDGDGTLLSIVPVTFDGGSGPDDMLAFLFSNGQVFLYQGDDPGSAYSWEQVTRWVIPQPRGYRPWVNIGATTVVGTISGPVDLQRSLSTGPSDISATFSQKISGVVTVDPATVNITRIEYLQVQNERLLIQTKWEGATLRECLVMDTDARAWTLFGNWAEAIGALTTIGGRLIASDGSSTSVTEYSEGTTDYYDNTTNGVSYDYVSAYWDFNAPGVRKQITGVTIRSSGTLNAVGFAATVSIARDLEVSGFSGAGTPGTAVAVSSTTISTASSGEAMYTCSSNGFEFAIGFSYSASVAFNSDFKLYGFDVLIKTGGPI